MADFWRPIFSIFVNMCLCFFWGGGIMALTQCPADNTILSFTKRTAFNTDNSKVTKVIN